LLYDLVHGPSAKKVLAQAFKGGKHSALRMKSVPKAIANPPKLFPGLSGTYEAFWELATDKPRLDAAIPSSKVRAWAREEEYSEEKTHYFKRAIRKMDLALMEWRRDKAGSGKPGEIGKPRQPLRG
jgi:hypothetical protein